MDDTSTLCAFDERYDHDSLYDFPRWYGWLGILGRTIMTFESDSNDNGCSIV